MVVLIDTNVVIDFLGCRDPFASNARSVFQLCATKQIVGFVAAHTLPDVFYILRKKLAVKKRKEMLLHLCGIVDIVGYDKQHIISALENEQFKDFEDCLQSECALAVGARYIITRNTEDFAASPVPPSLPEELLAELKPAGG